ncbi:TPA: hypothetical protein PXJ75_002863 [Yersinia enterocolitica]|nr:hypothetical protein [Yersinia enterocolitica]HDL6769217.1 hypothetical protein [Yersinia enterocolitica]
MAVPNQTPYTVYTANGVTTVFPFNFMVFSATDLAVSINGTVLNSGFTVSGVGIVNGGAVTFLAPPASGVTVMLARVMPLVRVTEYQDNGDLLAATVNKDFDRIWMVLQGQAVDNGLALSRPGITYNYYAGGGYRITDIANPVNDHDVTTKSYVDALAQSNDQHTLRVPENIVGVIPNIALRRNMLLAFNDAGDPIAVTPQSGSAADVLIQLAKPAGAGLIGTESGTVQGDLISINNTLDSMKGGLSAETIGRFIAKRSIVSSAVIPKTAGAKWALIRAWSAGGGGGGAGRTVTAGNASQGWAGQSGSFIEVLVDVSGLSNYDCFIGLGGLGGAPSNVNAGNPGLDGGDTTITGILKCPGGKGGQPGVLGSGNNTGISIVGTALPTATLGTILDSSVSDIGAPGAQVGVGPNQSLGGRGGSAAGGLGSVGGQSGRPIDAGTDGTGGDGKGHASGGGGGSSVTNTTGFGGGKGTGGFISITEFA